MIFSIQKSPFSHSVGEGVGDRHSRGGESAAELLQEPLVAAEEPANVVDAVLQDADPLGAEAAGEVRGDGVSDGRRVFVEVTGKQGGTAWVGLIA